MNNADLPAMPVEVLDYDRHGNLERVTYGGLTKREYFAAKAMQGLLASGLHQVDDTLCHEAWGAAGLMLACQEKTS